MSHFSALARSSSILFLFLFSVSAFAKPVHYELHIAKGPEQTIMVNGTIPGPTLEFTEGDDAEIVVHNDLKDDEASIHWHGILLPNLEDGVPYVSTPPILAGQSRTFRFPIRQHGTYWYHSHTSMQEQNGVYAALVIHPKEPEIKADKELVVVLSDWSEESGEQILRNMRKDGDYYLYKKHAVRSYFGALAEGGLGVQLQNEWQRMGGMDLSDVGYDSFLINGKKESQLLEAKPGETIRVRIINAGSSSYFYVSLGQAPFQVISADGMDIDPMMAKQILIGMAETYDLLFTVPASGGNFELRATAQDVTGFASGWIGQSAKEKISAPTLEKPKLYAPMNHSMHSGPSTVDKDGMRSVNTLTVDDVAAAESTELPATAPLHDIKLALDGNMGRYIWYINGKAIFEDRNIEIKAGERVRFTFENKTMMHHPMHLHGHFFRVLNDFDDRSPLKHTVDVPPHGTRVIEFLANEPGEWMLHCHNLYHMHNGMARVVKYMSFIPSHEVMGADHDSGGPDPHLHDHIYWSGEVEAASNHGKARVMATNTWNSVELKSETREDHKGHWEVEGDLFYRRYITTYFTFVGGGTVFNGYLDGIAGLGYTLPMLVEVQAMLNSNGEFRGDAHKRFQWTSSIFTDAELTVRQSEKPEMEISLMYGPSWHWAAGLMLTEDRLGFGALAKF